MERLYPHLEAARLASGIAAGRKDITKEYLGLSAQNKFMVHDAALALLAGEFGPWSPAVEAIWREWTTS